MEKGSTATPSLPHDGQRSMHRCDQWTNGGRGWQCLEIMTQAAAALVLLTFSSSSVEEEQRHVVGVQRAASFCSRLHNLGGQTSHSSLPLAATLLRASGRIQLISSTKRFPTAIASSTEGRLLFGRWHSWYQVYWLNKPDRFRMGTRGSGDLLRKLNELAQAKADLSDQKDILSIIEQKVAVLLPLHKKYVKLKSQFDLKSYDLSLFQNRVEKNEHH